MSRWLVLLALPLLVTGCGSSSRAPTATIDSYRTSYLSGQPLPDPPQVAVAPAEADTAADQPTKDTTPSKAATAAPKKAGPAPYKASVAAYIKRYAVDSNSLKLAKISAPFDGSVNGQKGPVVCVELSGTGNNRTAYLLKDNAVADSEFGAKSCQGKQMQLWDSAGA
jgi:hypothetical protein